MSSRPHSFDIDRRRALRAQLRARRAAIGTGERIAAAAALVAELEKIPEFMTDERIAGYWAVGGELPLASIHGGLRARGQTFFLPVLEAGQTLRFAPWKVGDPVAPNRYGIPEPDVDPSLLVDGDALDLVLVPLLGFDRSGHRIGSGAGYYDRTFSFLAGGGRPSRPVLAGIGYARQEIAAIDAAEWDIPLDYIATEDELIAVGDAAGATLSAD